MRTLTQKITDRMLNREVDGSDDRGARKASVVPDDGDLLRKLMTLTEDPEMRVSSLVEDHRDNAGRTDEEKLAAAKAETRAMLARHDRPDDFEHSVLDVQPRIATLALPVDANFVRADRERERELNRIESSSNWRQLTIFNAKDSGVSPPPTHSILSPCQTHCSEVSKSAANIAYCAPAKVSNQRDEQTHSSHPNQSVCSSNSEAPAKVSVHHSGAPNQSEHSLFPEIRQLGARQQMQQIAAELVRAIGPGRRVSESELAEECGAELGFKINQKRVNRCLTKLLKLRILRKLDDAKRGKPRKPNGKDRGFTPVPAFYAPHVRRLVLRDQADPNATSKGDIPFTHNAETLAMEAELERLNAMWREHELTLHNGATATVVLWRIFNGSFEFGGRVYCNRDLGRDLHGTSAQDRKAWRIDGEQVAELDFSAMHPNLMRAAHGLEPIANLYEAMAENEKAMMKKVILAGLNASNLDGAARSVIRSVRAMCGIDSNGPDDWKLCHRCFRMESDIAIRIMMEMAQADIPCFPVHDSFVVAEQHRAQLRNAMETAFMNEFGFVPPIKEK